MPRGYDVVTGHVAMKGPGRHGKPARMHRLPTPRQQGWSQPMQAGRRAGWLHLSVASVLLGQHSCLVGCLVPAFQFQHGFDLWRRVLQCHEAGSGAILPRGKRRMRFQWSAAARPGLSWRQQGEPAPSREMVGPAGSSTPTHPIDVAVRQVVLYPQSSLACLQCFLTQAQLQPQPAELSQHRQIKLPQGFVNLTFSSLARGQRALQESTPRRRGAEN